MSGVYFFSLIFICENGHPTCEPCLFHRPDIPGSCPICGVFEFQNLGNVLLINWDKCEDFEQCKIYLNSIESAESIELDDSPNFDIHSVSSGNETSDSEWIPGSEEDTNTESSEDSTESDESIESDDSVYFDVHSSPSRNEIGDLEWTPGSDEDTTTESSEDSIESDNRRS